MVRNDFISGYILMGRWIGFPDRVEVKNKRKKKKSQE